MFHLHKKGACELPIVSALAFSLATACHFEAESPDAPEPVARDGTRVEQDELAADASPECTLEARPSAVLQLVDQNGSAIADPQAVVSYAFDDETALKPARCMEPGCERWVAGHAKSGRLTVTARACGGTGMTEVEVPMTADACHVDTQYPRLTVNGAECQGPLAPAPSACDLQARPSVVALTALHAGDVWLTNTVKVEMAEDGCHVQTQYVPMLFDADQWCDPISCGPGKDAA